MTSATINLLSVDKLTSDNHTTLKNTINIVLIIDNLRFVQLEECPQVPFADAPQNIRDPYERWIKANEKARVYILTSLTKVLAKKHESMVTTCEIMDSSQEMFGQPSS
ncbi:uncharacterized protein LOC120081093 [Benincasa hispida]|uniref:uncharacterized protein LOC120081093 n=1 Tax=Benincasa hispida TaxID=102211 RepID=UPI001900BB10|nr:uncharacterized protein LOC120081093 [Benincasa hispida]